MKKTNGSKPLPNYTFGVEIETFGVHGAVLAWGLKKNGLLVTGRHATPETPAEQRRRAREQGAWDLGDDGSIRGDHPIEIRSPVLSGRKGLKEIEKVCRVLNELGSQANASCGLHVHVGITNAEKQGEKPFTIPEILTVLKRYQAWEKTIDGFVASGRREGKNNYCASISGLVKTIDTEVEKCKAPAPEVAKVDTTWASARSTRDGNRTNAEMLTGCDCGECVVRAVTVENRRLQDEYNQKYQRRINLNDVTTLAQFGDHYHKVSVTPLTKYGTLEFRQHHGTTKGKEITNWVRFLLNHIEVSRRLTVASEPIVTAVIPEGASAPEPGSVEVRKGARGPAYKDKDVTMGLRTHVKKHFLGQKARFAPRPRRTKKAAVQAVAIEAAPTEVPREPLRFLNVAQGTAPHVWRLTPNEMLGATITADPGGSVTPPETVYRVHFEDLGTPVEIARRPANALQQNPITGRVEAVHVEGPVTEVAVIQAQNENLPTSGRLTFGSPPDPAAPSVPDYSGWSIDHYNIAASLAADPASVLANPLYMLLNSPYFRLIG
jgi:hypothetical protein